jgi:hypothetical protein
MPNLSIRLSDEEVEILDRLVIGVRAYYERQVVIFPPAAKLAKETTRSSALRDLLLSWEHRMNAPEVFSHELTEPAQDGG